MHSAPVIRERIPSGRAQITGRIHQPRRRRDLAIVLRAGALPAPVNVLEERTVGPSLGADSIRQGLIATLTAAAGRRRLHAHLLPLSGLIADVALGLNLVILMAAMAGFHATLTLPGIAGIVLTIGMAVDTNILIFERIREELRCGKTVRAAIEAGFSRAFRTVIDTHVTVLGLGGHPLPVRHGAGEGLRRLARHRHPGQPVHRGLLHPPALRPDLHGAAAGGAHLHLGGGVDMLQIFVNPRYDFIGKRRWFYLRVAGRGGHLAPRPSRRTGASATASTSPGAR